MDQNVKQLRPWPYPTNYGKENTIETDVLVIGGGIAGCHGAISAAKRGVKVTVVDKCAVIRSGEGGAGVDHWGGAFSNPCCTVTPDEMAERRRKTGRPVSLHGSQAANYIVNRESYDALLDMEQMGIRVRDEDDEFVGADFRDDETKLMFAYDYKARYCIRVAGAKMKPALHKELKRLGVQIVDRVMVTALLTEDREDGRHVTGAMGFHVRTGEFYILRAKSILISTAVPTRLWVSSPETMASDDAENTGDVNASGDGHAMQWRAGARFALMEASFPTCGPMRYLNQTVGNTHNTWHGCTIVDADGKEVPWVDRDGNILKTVKERFYPQENQKMLIDTGGKGTEGVKGGSLYEVQGPTLIPDLPERIRKGEYKLPFYADLPSMPEHERRAIWGLMIGNEGKTNVPVYQAYSEAGFDPDKDMLQANVLPSFAAGSHQPWWNAEGVSHPQWRDFHFMGAGGAIYDWDLQTDLKGLFNAGQVMAGGAAGHPGAASTGRYAGRHAAAFAKKTKTLGEASREQIDTEKERVYAPTKREEGYGWKELRNIINRTMREYCAEEKSTEVLNMGLYWLNELRNNEVKRMVAHNPHDLMRTMEWLSRMDIAELVMHSCLARKRSCPELGFVRLDQPEGAPENEQDLFATVKRKDNGEVEYGYLSGDYMFEAPNFPTCRENYEAHCLL